MIKRKQKHKKQRGKTRMDKKLHNMGKIFPILPVLNKKFSIGKREVFPELHSLPRQFLNIHSGIASTSIQFLNRTHSYLQLNPTQESLLFTSNQQVHSNTICWLLVNRTHQQPTLPHLCMQARSHSACMQAGSKPVGYVWPAEARKSGRKEIANGKRSGENQQSI